MAKFSLCGMKVGRADGLAPGEAVRLQGAAKGGGIFEAGCQRVIEQGPLQVEVL
jgi:hypothetical protein